MADVLQIIALVVIYSMVLGALPLLLLHLVRRLAEDRRRITELQARVDLLEGRVGRG